MMPGYLQGTLSVEKSWKELGIMSPIQKSVGEKREDMATAHVS